MSVKFITVPQKRLLAAITSASTSFYLNNILSFDGLTNIAVSDLGTQHYCAFRNDTGTVLELVEIDPSTLISGGAITMLRRGLSFYGDRTTETTALKLDWPTNSICMLGSDIPQIFQYLKEYIDAAAIAGAVPASTSAAGIVVEASQAEVNAGTITKTIASVVYKLFAPLDKLLALLASTTQQGLVEEATQAEVSANTAAGGTGARLFINPSVGPAISTAASATLSLTTVAGQRVIVFAKGTYSGSSSASTVVLAYNGVTKDTCNIDGIDGTNESNCFSLMYTETPGAATQNITVTSGYSLANVVIIALKL